MTNANQLIEQRFLKPGDGRKPRHPVSGRNVEPTGEYFVDSAIIRKMVKDGDLVATTPPKTKRGK